MKKISKWNEINYETFKDVFYRFVEHEEWTGDLVLEIQDPLQNCRMYIGNCLSIEGWDCYCDQPYLELLKSISKINGEEPEKAITSPDRKCIVVCILEDKHPLIVPIMNTGIQAGSLLAAFFGDSMGIEEENKDLMDTSRPKWYTKDPAGNRVVDIRHLAFENYRPKDRFIRTRTISYTDWLADIKGWLDEGKEIPGTEEDFKDFTIISAP